MPLIRPQSPWTGSLHSTAPSKPLVITLEALVLVLAPLGPGVTTGELENLWSVLAAILHLGQLEWFQVRLA